MKERQAENLEIAVFDTETTSFSRGDPEFVLGCGIVRGVETRLDTLDDLVRWYLAIPPSIPTYAHNGGRFDFLLLLSALAPYLDDKGIQIDGTLSGSALASVKIPGHSELRDSYKLFPASLAKLTGCKTAFPLSCRCGSHCGGYCAPSYGLTGEERDLLYTYCRNDTIILRDMVLGTVKALQEAGIQVIGKGGLPRLTAASVAVATSFKVADEPQKPIPLEEYQLTIKSYYGGRVECFYVGDHLGGEWGALHCYDVKSLYPAMASLAPLPTGTPVKVCDDEAVTAFDSKSEGMYFIRAYSKPQKAAPLPRREHGRVVYATGEISGWYALPELLGALPYLDWIEIRQAYLYSETRDFSAFYALAFALKDKAEQEGRLGHREAYKIIANGDTGKRCQRLGGWQLTRSSEVREGDWLTASSEYVVRPRIEDKPPWCARPMQGAYITARSRALMLPHLQSVDVAYSDTDSLMRRERMPSGNSMGEFADEGLIVGFECIGPKAYRGIKAGVPLHKIKGLTLGDAKGASKEDRERIDKHNQLQWDLYVSGKGAKFPGVAGVRSALKNLKDQKGGTALLQARTIERANRAHPNVCGSRYVMPGGLTVSLHKEGGRYLWPGVSIDPRDLLDWLPKREA